MEPGQTQRDGSIPQQLSDTLSQLSDLLLDEQDLDAILDLVVSRAPGAIGPADAASITLLKTGSFETRHATSEEAREADAVQYASGNGPCIAATQEGERHNVALRETAPRWPEFAAAAIDRGFRGVLSTPLGVRDRKLGALNLYSRTTDVFPPAAVEAAQLLAHQASVVLANAIAYAAASVLKDQLREALASRDVIGQAKGILMAREACTPDEAFDILRKGSQRTNHKLRDVAQHLVEANTTNGDDS
jgi:GAF domain-containing protein